MLQVILTKISEVLDSGNAWTTIIALVSLVFAYFGFPVEGAPTEILDQLTGERGAYLLVSIFVLIGNPIKKISKKFLDGELSLDIFKSKNFWVQILSGLILWVGTKYGFVEEAQAIIIAIFGNASNFSYHILKKPKK